MVGRGQQFNQKQRDSGMKWHFILQAFIKGQQEKSDEFKYSQESLLLTDEKQFQPSGLNTNREENITNSAVMLCEVHHKNLLSVLL